MGVIAKASWCANHQTRTSFINGSKRQVADRRPDASRTVSSKPSFISSLVNGLAVSEGVPALRVKRLLLKTGLGNR